MRCEMMKDIILIDYIDGRLKGDALRDVESHLSSCAACRKLAEEAMALSASLKSFPKEAPAPGVWRAIERELIAFPAKTQFADNVLERLRSFIPHPRPAFVMATVTAIIIFTLIAVRFIPVTGNIPYEMEEYDIFSASSVNTIGEDGGFGTELEDAFL